MAKLIAPLLSEAAHGKIAGVLTFSRRTSGNQARYQRDQKDYENAARKIARDAFRNALLLWNALTTAEKAYWDEIESKGYADV